MFKALFSWICKLIAGERPVPVAVCGPVTDCAPYCRWVEVENALGIPVRGYLFTSSQSDAHGRGTEWLKNVMLSFDAETSSAGKFDCAFGVVTAPVVTHLLLTIRKRWATGYQPARHYDPEVGLLLVFTHEVEPTLVFSFKAINYPSVELLIDELADEYHLFKESRAHTVEELKAEVPRTSFESESRGAAALRPNISPRNTVVNGGYNRPAVRYNGDADVLHQRNLAMFHESCNDRPVVRDTPSYTPSFSSRCDDTPSRDDTPSYDSGSCGGSSD